MKREAGAARLACGTLMFRPMHLIMANLHIPEAAPFEKAYGLS